MNDTSSVVGYYQDAAHFAHGFIKDGERYTTLDFPGAIGTIPIDINNSGVVVGYYFRSDGYPHGFSFKNGRFTQLDYPGSADTIPERVNSSGVISGEYDATQPVTHGFTFDGRSFQVINTPYGTQSEAAALNDAGTIVGNAWTTDPFPSSGFIKTRNALTKFDVPDQTATFLSGVNNFGDMSGYYIDTYAYGFVQLLGYIYVTHPYQGEYVVLDINNKREILGHAYNWDAGEYQPVIGRPPLTGGGN